MRLVDSDNRGRVDFDRRISMPETIEQKLALNQENLIDDRLDHWRGGGVEMFLMQKAIRFRSENSVLFQDGDFLSLQVTGQRSRNVVAFLRRHKQQCVLTALPRWLSRIAESSSRGRPEFDWQGTFAVARFA